MTSAKDKNMVTKAIKTFFPHARIFAFGSRVKGVSKKYSDLDIAIESEGGLELNKLAQLKEVLAQSELTYLVDIIDLEHTDAEFKAHLLNNAEEW